MGALEGEYRCPVPEIRAFRPDDFDQVLDLLAARSLAAFGDSEEKESREVRRQWLSVPGTEGWVAVADEEIVGHATLNESHDVGIAAVDPAVNDALLATVESRARERGFDTLAVISTPDDKPLDALVRRSGFDQAHEVLRMSRELNGDLPEPVWAEGVAVRTYEEADGERVHKLLDDAYLGWDETYIAQSHEGWLSFMTHHQDFDPEMWFLVERDGELVACALHWRANQRRGWVKDIVVAAGERGRGLGKALLHHAFREYAARDVERVGLKVDSSNPTGAPQLYERVGFRVNRRYGTWVKRL
jgi:ribosomal protein S18 acetylase RimI-like enzyme